MTTLSLGSSEGMSALPRHSSFARHLRSARVKRGLSAAKVADQVGVSSVSIYLWETDHCRPRDRNLTALCRVLKLPIRATRAMAVG
jgi:transcriptional regulator with XRE-family HTH domain